ncbi:hypothetical protein [Paenibacillus sp. EKM212P]|nr:hypothetical protein [Paenibacillus sp. EKM212P]
MKRKIFLTFLASSFILIAMVTVPLYFHDQEPSYHITFHGEM